MDLQGNIILFPERKKAADGREFTTVKTSVSTKDEHGLYISKSLVVKFSKDNFPEEKISKLDPNYFYVFKVENALLTVRSYVSKKTGERNLDLCVFIKSGTIIERKERKKQPQNAAPAGEELPF